MKAVPDTRPANGAWAPGNYECLCANCRDSFVGDKRAMVCADCAYNNGWRDIATAPRDGTPIIGHVSVNDGLDLGVMYFVWFNLRNNSWTFFDDGRGNTMSVVPSRWRPTPPYPPTLTAAKGHGL